MYCIGKSTAALCDNSHTFQLGKFPVIGRQSILLSFFNDTLPTTKVNENKMVENGVYKDCFDVEHISKQDFFKPTVLIL